MTPESGRRDRGAGRALSGLDRLISDRGAMRRLAGRRVGLLTNHASTTVDHVPAAAALARRLDELGGSPPRLFAPEHGIGLSAGAGEAVGHGTDPLTGLPAFSLYAGPGRVADGAFDGLGALVIDLRDVGVRCYTHAATAAEAARAALERRIEVIVCDRANPIGNAAQGPRPDPGKRSAFARFDVPFVHGRTIGELIARDVAAATAEAPFALYPADASTAPGLGWIPPSPALSHPDAVAAYAGLVLLEATNVSEGRGTSVPFRCVTAPGIDAEALAAAANGWPAGFGAEAGEIVSARGPAAGQATPGIVIWPRRAARREPLAFGVRLLAWLIDNHPGFAWRPTAGGGSGAAIDALFGRSDLREHLDAGDSADDILRGWAREGAYDAQKKKEVTRLAAIH